MYVGTLRPIGDQRGGISAEAVRVRCGLRVELWELNCSDTLKESGVLFPNKDYGRKSLGERVCVEVEAQSQRSLAFHRPPLVDALSSPKGANSLYRRPFQHLLVFRE